MVWSQVYNPFGNAIASTLVAAIPVAAMLIMLAFLHVKAHWAAVIALALALSIAVLAFTMPADMAFKAVFLGLINGFFPIGWIILNVIFLYRLCVDKGALTIVQNSLGAVTPDRRLQLLLIAFSFGAFFEGAAGFGTPVAVTGAILIGLGFSPLAASGLALIANTAPVAFGALGTPIVTLAAVMKLTDGGDHDAIMLGAMVGRQLPLFSFIVPFWLIYAFAGWRGMLGVWPAITVCGLFFAVPQYLISNYHGPWLVDVGAALISMAALASFLKIWSPKEIWHSPKLRGHDDQSAVSPDHVNADQAIPAVHPEKATTGQLMAAWTPWIILCVFVFIWGTQTFKDAVNPLFLPKWPIEGLHNLVQKVPPAVPAPAKEGAVFAFNILTMSGTAILLSAIVSGLIMKYSPVTLVKQYVKTLWVVRYSLITISAMLALGTLTRYAGIDATLGLAFANTGFFYPFFGTLLGWLGVALTGSDTASNVLFGGLQKVSANQLGLSPLLMGAANSSGGVMGKMIDAQSIVVASTATGWYGHEGDILRYVFKHSIMLAALVGCLVMLEAYVWPFTALVLKY
jgi:lactate permease